VIAKVPRWLQAALTSTALVAAVTVVIALLEPGVPALGLGVLYLVAVVPIALVYGGAAGAAVSVASMVAFDFLCLAPRGTLDPGSWEQFEVLGAFLLASLVVSQAAARSQREARRSARLGSEQAALRRVATLVARGTPPEKVFPAVADEVGRLLSVDLVSMGRYESNGTLTFVAAWGKGHEHFPIGSRRKLGGNNLGTIVFETGRSARIDDYGETSSGPVSVTAREAGIKSTLATPILVDGRLWGVIAVHMSSERALPADTEARLEGFTELAATAISNTESRTAQRRLADEQAALRRVATLVARGAPPAQLFTAVSEEVGQLFGADQSAVGRFESDGPAIVLVGSSPQDLEGVPLGTRWELDDALATATVFRTGLAARVDEGVRTTASGPIPDNLRRLGIRTTVASPIVVEGRLWGAMTVSTKLEPLAADTEERLANFTQLVATAIANAESRSELAASRARIVAASDETRRRIERNLHDGIQQRLVAVGFGLRAAQVAVPPQLDELRDELTHVAEDLATVVDELRDIAQGIHPGMLSKGGLQPALKALCRRSPVPVELDLHLGRRLPERVEVAAYYVTSETLANASKHAQASVVRVVVDERDEALHLAICDDGRGGADPAGSGLTGLRDRVEAIGGSIDVTSGVREGTLVVVELPFQRENTAEASALTEPVP
jgi:signal transduction histidine kinase